MYKNTVTLFNRKPGSRGEGSAWLPTVLKNVNLNTDKAVIAAQYGTQSTDTAVLNVRYTKDGEEILVAEKPWMPPMEWDKTVDSLTFATGDFFWEGEWTGGIPVDADYEGGFYEYMNQSYDYVFLITSVTRLSVIPHFEITGR